MAISYVDTYCQVNFDCPPNTDNLVDWFLYHHRGDCEKINQWGYDHFHFPGHPFYHSEDCNRFFQQYESSIIHIIGMYYSEINIFELINQDDQTHFYFSQFENFDIGEYKRALIGLAISVLSRELVSCNDTDESLFLSFLDVYNYVNFN